MSRRAGLLGVVSGVAIGAVAALVVGLSRPVAAQPAPPVADAGRYQISSWGYSASVNAGAVSERGAYILDTRTGEVYSVVGDQRPQPVGRVGAKGPGGPAEPRAAPDAGRE